MNIQTKTVSAFHDEFLKETFSVDAFLQNYSGTYTLEGLRDSLSHLFKALEGRMIDIVNSESDTILSLPSSLNGLDERIDSLRSSLEQLREEVMSLLRIIEYTLQSIKNCIHSKKMTIVEKRGYANLIQAMECCNRVKLLLDKDSCTKPLESDVFLRAVDQYVLLQSHLSKCDRNQLTQTEQTDLVTVTNLVFEHYTELFLIAYKSRDLGQLVAVFQMGVFLQKQRETEILIRKKIVSPFMDKMINEKSLKHKGLSKFYEEILKFISTELEILLKLTNGSKENRKNGIRGYNIFINSIWLDIEEKLRVNLNSIFAPGNPVVFQTRFTETITFIDQIDKIYGNKKDTIHSHPSYGTHMKRWNLPIYFQICFNEIVLEYEKVLARKFDMFSNSNDFKLLATDSAYKSISHCLSDTIYIPQVVHKFWKLILQIISRYNSWLDQQLSKCSPADESNYENKLRLLVSIHYDIRILSNKIQDININKFPRENRSIISTNIISSKEQLLNKLNAVEVLIINTISNSSMVALKQVKHIPRLYRKTNRTLPTEPAQYCTQIFDPPNLFVSNYKKYFADVTCDLFLTQIYQRITNEYETVVGEILTQVRKTEDSLRRLKKGRQQQSAEGGTVGDDQKIRTQLQLDVTFYCNQIQKVALNIELNSLQNLVKDVM